MKRFLFVTAALLAMSVSFSFGQSKEDIKASIDRCAKLEKLCSKQPKQTGVADVDTYVQGVYNAAISSVASSSLLQNLYYRQIGGQWKFSGDKHKSLQVDTERTFHQRYPLVML